VHSGHEAHWRARVEAGELWNIETERGILIGHGSDCERVTVRTLLAGPPKQSELSFGVLCALCACLIAACCSPFPIRKLEIVWDFDLVWRAAFDAHRKLSVGVGADRVKVIREWDHYTRAQLGSLTNTRRKALKHHVLHLPQTHTRAHAHAHTDTHTDTHTTHTACKRRARRSTAYASALHSATASARTAVMDASPDTTSTETSTTLLKLPRKLPRKLPSSETSLLKLPRKLPSSETSLLGNFHNPPPRTDLLRGDELGVASERLERSQELLSLHFESLLLLPVVLEHFHVPARPHLPRRRRLSIRAGFPRRSWTGPAEVRRC
jgi:hypothetical protein